MDYHMLNTHIAKQCGVNASLILVNLKFWIEKNRANEKHFHDGRFWTYCSAEAMCRVFDYLSPKQIRTAINKLIESGYIVKGNYNKSAYDRTSWYAITDKGYALFERNQGENQNDHEGNSIFPNGKIENTLRENQNDHEGTPIPDIITDIVPDVFPPNPPEGGTGDATLFSDAEEPPQAEPSPPKAKRGTRQKDPAKSPELTPDEESALLAYSPGLCDAVRDWFRYKAERRQMYGETFRRRFLGQVTKNASQYGVDAVTELIENCLSNGYQGVIWDKLPQMTRNVSPQYGGNRANVADWDSIFAKLEGEIGHDATGNP